jgi:hypothetical protein
MTCPEGTEVEVVNARSRPRYPQEWPDIRCIGGWVGLQGRSGRVGKISPLSGFDPRTVQPVASRYTDCAILAHTKELILLNLNL